MLGVNSIDESIGPKGGEIWIIVLL